MTQVHDIEMISAPSILGLSPSGVEYLAESLLAAGLAEKLQATQYPVVHVPTYNKRYSNKRDPATNCLNTLSIRDFSLDLSKCISQTLDKKCFPIVLGGDCSILLGIMPALKAKGLYGLVFLDAHADFYEPEKSVTGEVADMDLAIVTGRGPELLTNIGNLQPYTKDQHVIHVGQRDQEETKKYGSQDIRQTAINCFPLAEIKKEGITGTIKKLLHLIGRLPVEGFWIHFDTDVLSDDINPAVDYRLPDGLLFEEVEQILRSLLSTGSMQGISITIFNPLLDKDKSIAKSLIESVARAFGRI